jgi:microcystin-dependent protein
MTTIPAGALIPVSQINQWCPPGVVDDFAGAVAPDGWLLCDGASYLRSAYPDLFAVIGTTYGAADGTHFNVPDLRGRVVVGYAAAGGHTDVSTLGANDGQAVANRRPKHRTTNGLSIVGGPFPTAPGSNGFSPGSNTFVVGAGSGSPSLSGSIGTNIANDALDTPSYIVLNKIIRAKDV